MFNKPLYLCQADVAPVGLTMTCNLGLALDDMAAALTAVFGSAPRTDE